VQPQALQMSHQQAKTFDHKATPPNRFLGAIYTAITVPEHLWPVVHDGKYALLILTRHRVKTLEDIFDFEAGADREECDALVARCRRLEVEIDEIEENAEVEPVAA
jgi:hypothetical protein